MRIKLVLLMSLMIVAPLTSSAEAAPPEGGRVEISETPQAYLKGCLNNAARRMDGKYTGDEWTWHARFPMDGFIDAYLASRDKAWLEGAEEYFNWCLDQLLTGPDGRKGWIGAAYRMPGRLGEYPVGDVLMMKPMVRFAELVLKDEPALEKRFGESARRYVKLATELAFEKWEQRGIWHEDGRFGAYTNWPWTFTEAAPDHWHAPPPGKAVSTLPINMQVYWGSTAAMLWRITGEDRWLDRATRIFDFAKSRLNLYDDHYSWNYWEPFGQHDLKAGNPQDFSSWIETHPYVAYQLGEVAAFVEAYHRGITFDETDMRRFVKTNLEVMWNGQLDDIQWNNSNAGMQKAALGEIRLETARADGRRAGTLWTALVDFDARARKIHEEKLQAGSIEHAYYHNVVAAQEPDFGRRYGKEVRTFDFDFNPCSTITMASVLPSTIRRGQYVVVACQARLPGDLKVELVSADGKRPLATLTEAKIRLIHNHIWDTSEIEPGSYRIRWTLAEQFCEFPITVR